MTHLEFLEKYGEERKCLDALLVAQGLEACPKCGKKLYKMRTRKAYVCGSPLGHQTSATANTIFKKSTTPLVKWFYAVYLFSISKNGVSAKELERQLGVSYHTAHRIAKHIRYTMDLRSGEEEDSLYLRSQFVNSIKGTHHAISDMYFKNYLAEYIFRYQHRKDALVHLTFSKVLKNGAIN